jgi:predicted DNA-binding transcriptional regulator AlpA
MAALSTGLSRAERGAGNGGIMSGIDPVRTVKEVAKLISVGEPTLRTMLREGRGPVVTKLSHKRIGIRDSHLRAWLDSRAVAAQPAE